MSQRPPGQVSHDTSHDADLWSEGKWSNVGPADAPRAALKYCDGHGPKLDHNYSK